MLIIQQAIRSATNVGDNRVGGHRGRASSSDGAQTPPPVDFHEMFSAAKAHLDTLEFAQANLDQFVRRPVWFKRPDIGDILAAYPPKAIPTDAKGFAMLFCQVNERGRLAPCEIIGEQHQDLNLMRP
jgi:hypothetical protein